MKKYQIVVLALLVLLPASLPIGGRFQLIFPLDPQADNPLSVIFLMLVLILPYWGLLGSLSRLWIGHFTSAFFLMNIPIFLNVIGEILYFSLLQIPSGEHLFWEYLVGSHIDKLFLIFMGNLISKETSIIATDLIALLCFLVVFSLGYLITYRYQRKENHASLIP